MVKRTQEEEMSKWHGRNKSNKQKGNTYLSSKGNKTYLSKRNSINLPIIFYCKICKSDFTNENQLNKHPCK